MITSVVSIVLVFGIMIFVHELGHFIMAKRAKITVTEFAIGMGPVLYKKEKNGTIYSIRLLPIGGFTAMEGEDDGVVNSQGSFGAKTPMQRFWVLIAGSVGNFILGYILLVVLTAMTGYVGTTSVVKFAENAVSSQALQVGDTITKVNGHTVRTSNDITYEFLRDTDGIIDITLTRDNQSMTAPVPFRLEELDGMHFIDIDFKVAAVPAKPLDYVTYPVNWGLSIIKSVWGSLIDLLTGRVPVNQLSGPVGIVSAIGQASKMGLDSVIMLAAFLSINLGVFNLLPLPILDGGKILIVAIERMLGRPIHEKTINGIMGASVALVLAMVLFATYNDIFRLFKTF